MGAKKGFTLVELIIVIAILALLAAVLLPSLTEAKKQARLAACAAGMHNIHTAVLCYAAANRNNIPGFAFSDYRNPVLPLSSHWGGISQPHDPAGFGRRGVEQVNLWILAQDDTISAAQLVCPSAPDAMRKGQESFFASSSQFSTYCLRLPYSDDLFISSPGLGNFGGKTLGAYLMARGGCVINVGGRKIVPQVRLDCRYRISSLADCGDGVYDPVEDTMLADAFWHQDYSAPAPSMAALTTYPVRIARGHEEKFNVCSGNGAVKTLADNGTVRENSISPGSSLPDDGAYFATYAERIWQYFDASR